MASSQVIDVMRMKTKSSKQTVRAMLSTPTAQTVIVLGVLCVGMVAWKGLEAGLIVAVTPGVFAVLGLRTRYLRDRARRRAQQPDREVGTRMTGAELDEFEEREQRMKETNRLNKRRYLSD